MSGPRNSDGVSNPFFARVWTLMSAHETEALTRLRQDNLDALSGRVLEVGAGTGTNFAHYPPTVAEVLAVEPMSCLAEPPTLPEEMSAMIEELWAYHRAAPHETATAGLCTDVSHGYADRERIIRHDHIALIEAALPFYGSARNPIDMTAAVVGLGLAALAAVRGGMKSLTGKVDSTMSAMTIQTTF